MMLPRTPLRRLRIDESHDQPFTLGDALCMVDHIRALAHEREPYREFAPWAWLVRSMCDAILEANNALSPEPEAPHEQS